MKLRFLSLFFISLSAQGEVSQTGFYRIGGPADCTARHGKVVFLSAGANSPLTADRGCKLTFINNSLKTLGICSRVLAHKGFYRHYPSNTMPAFAAALDQGFHGFELDVWQSADGEVVVSHDDKLDPATSCEGSITKKDFAEFKDCPVTHSPVIPNTKVLARRPKENGSIPTLKAVLKKYLTDPRAQQIIIDIKPNPGGTRLIEALKKTLPKCEVETCRSRQERLTFISPSQEDIVLLKAAFPYANIAFEKTGSLGGIINEPDEDYWNQKSLNNTLSLSFGPLYDAKFNIWKFINGEPVTGKRNFKRLYEKNALQGPQRKRFLGWIINTKAGLLALKKYRIEDVLTELPYQEVVEVLMQKTSSDEILANLEKTKKGEKLGCE